MGRGLTNRIDVWKKDIFQAWTDFTGKSLIPQQVPFLQDIVNTLNHSFLIHANRSGGKTWLAAFFASFRIVTRTKPINVVVVSGSKRQSEKLLSYCMLFLTKIPELRKNSRERWPQSKSRLTWNDGSSIIALTSKSEKSLRSEHGSVLIYDESTGIDEHSLEISRGILTSEDPYWQIIYLSTPSEYGEHWFDHLLKRTDKSIKKYHWTLDDCVWIDKDLRDLMKEQLKGSILYEPEILGLPPVFKYSSKLTFPKELYSRNLISNASYSGGRICIGIDPNFIGKSPSASRSAAVVIERLNDKIIVHEAWDFSHCNTVKEQVEFILALAEDPLGVKVPCHALKIDSGASVFLATLSQHAHCQGLSFKNRTRLEARCVQFLPRCHFVTGGDERHLLRKIPRRRAFKSMSRLLEELRQYSPQWISDNKHDFTDAYMLAVYQEYKPLPSVVRGSMDWIDILKASSEASRSLNSRRRLMKSHGKLIRESQAKDPFYELMKREFKKKEKEDDH